jgi:hypothetical protein
MPEDYPIFCWQCGDVYNLFEAKWCAHPYSTTLCPGCSLCCCQSGTLGNAQLWIDAPEFMRTQGIRKLFKRGGAGR